MANQARGTIEATTLDGEVYKLYFGTNELLALCRELDADDLKPLFARVEGDANTTTIKILGRMRVAFRLMAQRYHAETIKTDSDAGLLIDRFDGSKATEVLYRSLYGWSEETYKAMLEASKETPAEETKGPPESAVVGGTENS